MLRHLLGFDMARRVLWARARPGPMKSYYRTDYATLDSPWDHVNFLAIDLETTGLDPRKDEILSVGFVPIRAGAVCLGEARHMLARPTRAIPEQTAVIHGLTDDRMTLAPALADVMPVVLKALTGHVPLAHFATIERCFLSWACRRLYDLPLTVPYVDTLALEQRTLDRRQASISKGSLRLHAARERYGLPRYKAHNAMIDAIAAGELFLAQVAHMDSKRPPRLDEVARG